MMAVPKLDFHVVVVSILSIIDNYRCTENEGDVRIHFHKFRIYVRAAKAEL